MNIKEELVKLNNKYNKIVVNSSSDEKSHIIYKTVMDFSAFLPIETEFKYRVMYFLNDLTKIKTCECGCKQDIINPLNRFIRGHSNRSETVKCKKINTYIEKYGVDNPSKVETIKQKKETSFLKHFGTTHFMKSKIGKNIVDQSNLNKYGLINPFQFDAVKDKIKLNRSIWQPEITKRSAHTRRIRFFERLFNSDRLGNVFEPLFNIDEYIGVGTVPYKFRCKKCNNITESTLDDGKLPRCFTCDPLFSSGGQSLMELELVNYIKLYCKDIKTDNRKEIYPLELDVFIPEKQLAFEFNGLYWHSELSGGKSYNYHLNKTKQCMDKSIRLVHIFEDEWRFKKKIVKNRIKNILGHTKYKLGARECTIKVVDAKTKNTFLNKYHIQGEDRCEINLGLYYKNRLLSVMTFSKLRKALGQSHKKGCYELSRYCTINNFNIMGGASKLLSYFELTFNPIMLKSYSDKRWNTGNVYKQLGFILTHESKPNYWYIDKNKQTRIHRYSFRKNILKDKLKVFDPVLSEWENMKLNGYDRICDCGNMVFVKEYI